MTSNRGTLSLTIRWFLLTVFALSTAALGGCGGDNPASLAGTIEVPDKKTGEKPDFKALAKSYTKKKGSAKTRKP